MKINTTMLLVATCTFACGANVEAIDIEANKPDSVEQDTPTLPGTEAGTKLSQPKETVAVAEAGQGDQGDKTESNPAASNQGQNDVKPTSEPEPLTLNLTFAGMKTAKGQLCFLVFADEASFPDQIENALVSECHLLEGLSLEVTVELSSLVDKIAISAFHDENMDNELNTLGALGIPTESYGFSNNPPFSFGPPSYEQAAIAVGQDQTDIGIQLTSIL